MISQAPGRLIAMSEARSGGSMANKITTKH